MSSPRLWLKPGEESFFPHRKLQFPLKLAPSITRLAFNVRLKKRPGEPVFVSQDESGHKNRMTLRALMIHYQYHYVKGWLVPSEKNAFLPAESGHGGF